MDLKERAYKRQKTEEALSQETVESLRRRELLISSVEKTSTYEVYPSIPKEILEKCHENGIHTAIDSSGGIPLQKCKEALDEADLILLDIKALPDDLCTRIIGQSSKNSIDILNYREKTGKSVWIRHVIVPGLTLDYGLLTSLADFLKNYKCIERIELLPFHKMGEYKWKELNKAYTLTDTPEPTYTEIENAKRIFSERGFNIK